VKKLVENLKNEENQEIITKISEVVIFLDGARVTRTSEGVTLDKGINTLKISGISKFMDSDSVRVKGLGKEIKATLVDVQVNYVYKEITGHKELDDLYRKLKQLKKEKNVINQQIVHSNWVNENFKTIVGNFTAEFPKFFAAGESNMDNLKAISEYSNETLINLQKRKFELEDKLEKNDLEISKVNKEIQKLGGQTQRVEEYYDIIVSIEAETSGIFELNVTYQIKGANWTPSYDVLITENETTINYRAEVINKTLEDWEDIHLEVSTATFKPVRVLEPQPWYIQEFVYRPPPRPSMMSADYKKMKKVKREIKIEEKEVEGIMAEPEPAPPPVEMAIEEAAFSEDSFGVEHYDIPKKMTIKADGNPHPVMLREFEVTSTRLFYWNSQDQQLVAQEKIKNGESTLLPGKCKCYVDGDFVGETSIKVISPGEEFKLGTRRSFEMKVEKKLVKREVGKKGITKGKLTNEYGYEIKINNYRKKESELLLIDRIPHSRSPDIEVDPEQKDEKHLDEFFNPVPTKFELGIATYELKLKPEEEFKIKYHYKVSYKKDITIDPPLP